MNPQELNNSDLNRSTHHISNVSNNTLNLSQNRVSALSISYISYFYNFYRTIIKAFPNIFAASFINEVSSLKNFIDCTLVRFRSCLNYFISCVIPLLSGNISNIQAIASLVTELPGLITEVLNKLKEAINGNMTFLGCKINEIIKSIKCLRKESREGINIICCIIQSNCNCNDVDNSSFKKLLEIIKSKLQGLWLELHELYCSYFYINCLRIQTQNIIKSTQNVSSLKTELCKLITRYKCSIWEFKKIKSKLESVKCKIEELKQLKPDSIKPCQSNGNTITYTYNCGNKTITTMIIIKGSNGNHLKQKLECLKQKFQSLGDEIEKVSSEFKKIEKICSTPKETEQACSGTEEKQLGKFGLKDLLKLISCCLQVTEPILSVLESIQSSVQSIKGKTSDLNNIGLSISLISRNVEYIKDVIDMVNEHRDDLGYVRDSLCSIIPNLCQIKNKAETIIGLGCVVAPLNNIKTSIEKLKKLESEDKWNEICQGSCENGAIKQALKCIRDNLNLSSITGKLDTVQNGINSLEIVICKIRELITNMETIEKILSVIEYLKRIINEQMNKFSTCSLKSLSNHLATSNIDSSGLSGNNLRNDPIIVNLSIVNVTNYKALVNSLFQCSKKIDQIFHLIPSPDGCQCILSLEKGNNRIDLGSLYVHKILDSLCTKPKDEFNKSFKLDQITGVTRLGGDPNHFCLCIINKYVLYPQLIKLMYIFGIDLDSLSTLSRKFDKYLFSTQFNQNIAQFLILVIALLFKVSIYILRKYVYGWILGRITIENKCFCCYYQDPSYYMIVSIIIYLSSLIQNIWSMDTHSIRVSIQCLSSLLSEYQSIHVYTNYYSPSLHNILPIVISGSKNEKSGKGTLSFSGIGIVENNKKLFTSNITSTTTLIKSKENSKTTSVITANTSLLNDSLKEVLISLTRIIIKTHLSKDKFSLIYSKFSGLLFYTKNSNFLRTGRVGIRNIVMEVSLKYLENICNSGQKCSCVENKECKICPIAKIRLSCVSISLKQIELRISNVSGDILLNYLIGSNSSKDFFSNLCVGFGEVYTAMSKNNYSTHFNTYTDHKNIANSFPGLTVGYFLNSVYGGEEGNKKINGMSLHNKIIKKSKNVNYIVIDYLAYCLE